jgi:hypothetical protein
MRSLLAGEAQRRASSSRRSLLALLIAGATFLDCNVDLSFVPAGSRKATQQPHCQEPPALRNAGRSE